MKGGRRKEEGEKGKGTEWDGILGRGEAVLEEIEMLSLLPGRKSFFGPCPVSVPVLSLDYCVFAQVTICHVIS